MCWVKTYFEITGDKDIISLLKNQLVVDGRFTIHKLFNMPDRLLIDKDELVSEILIFIDYLEESDYGVLEFTLRDLFRNDVVEFLSNNQLSILTTTIGNDLKNKKIHLDTPFTVYLEKYQKDTASIVIKAIKNYRDTGYYDSDSYYLDNIGSNGHPVECKLRFDTTFIKGNFFTKMFPPILFFKYLKETYNVDVKVSFLDMGSEEYITLLDDLSMPE